MAFGASSASAVEVKNTAGDHCGRVAVNAHVVSGGRAVEAVSERETPFQCLYRASGAFVTGTTCSDHLDAAIGDDGTGPYMVAATSGMAGPPCTRTQCDEANIVKRPWQV
jgi:hypothetical protein